MIAAHTPGPWTFYADLPSTEPNWHIVTNATRLRVIANVHIEPGNAADLANATLIAAAPELLDALKGLVAALSPEIHGASNSPLEIARATIAKAIGASA